MSGHSKWATTKHHKAIVDAKRGKSFSRHSKNIIVAARLGGGDPAMNNALALAIERAKADNMPNANIDRAIKSGTGELKDGAEISEVMYEGYGPGGVAVLIRVLTDNKNRAVANVRHTLESSGGSLGTSGTVAWMFKRKGTVTIPINGKDRDSLTLELIDLGADDVQDHGDALLLITEATKLPQLQGTLKEKKIEFANPAVSYIADNLVPVNDEEVARKVLKMMEKLEEDEDIDEVFSNFDMEEGVMEKVMG